MKASVFYKKATIKTEEYPVPTIDDTHVLVEVMACGVCGTDVHIFEGAKGAADVTPPVILGHEFSGVIKQIGNAVRGFHVGDRVSVDPNVLCGRCDYCRGGVGHFCTNMVGLGTTTNGGFAQYCAVPETQAYHIAPTTSFEAASMAEPLACCLHGIEMCDIKAGSTVAVIGGGMIGLLMLQLASISGAGKLILIEPVAEKLEVGKKLGADYAIDPSTENPKTALEKLGIHQIDTVIECVGRTQTIQSAIDLAGVHSTVMMFGLTEPEESISVKPFELFKKEITLKTSFINPYTMGRAIALIDSGKIDVTSMTLEPIPLSRLKDVLERPELRRKGKYIVNPQL